MQFTNILRAYWKRALLQKHGRTIYERRGHVQLVGSRPFQELQAAFPGFYDSAYEREVSNGNNKPRKRERENTRGSPSERMEITEFRRGVGWCSLAKLYETAMSFVSILACRNACYSLMLRPAKRYDQFTRERKEYAEKHRWKLR